MGAALKTGLIRTTTPTSTGTVDYTISGFGSVVAAILIWTRATTNATAADHLAWGWGVVSVNSESGGQRCSATCSQDNVPDSVTRRISCSDVCVLVMHNAGGTVTFEVKGDIDAFITDGIRVDYTAVGASGYALQIILIGGGASAYLGTINNTAANQDITGPGFEPKIVLVGGTWTAITAASSTLNSTSKAAMTLGCVWNQGGGTVTQRSVNWGSNENAAAGDPYERFSDDAAMLEIFQATVVGGASLGSFDSSGFTANQVGGVGTHGWYLALGGFDNSVWLGTLQSPTSVSDQSVTTPGFRPSFWLSGLSNTNDLNTNVEDAEGGSFAMGVADVGAAADRALCATDQNVVATMNTTSFFENVALLVRNHNGTATRNRGTMQSFDASGYTIDFDTVVGTAALYRWDLVIAHFELLSTTIASSSSQTMTLSRYRRLIGTVTTQSGQTFNLTRYRRLITTIAAQSGETFNLTAYRRLQTTIASQSAMSPNLTALWRLASTMAAQSGQTFDLEILKALVVSINAQSGETMRLTCLWALDTIIASATAMTANLEKVVDLETTIPATSTVSANLNRLRGLVATIPATSDLDALLSMMAKLATIVASQSGQTFLLSRLTALATIIATQSDMEATLLDEVFDFIEGLESWTIPPAGREWVIPAQGKSWTIQAAHRGWTVT